MRRNVIQKLFHLIYVFFRAIYFFFKTLVVPLSTLEPQKKGGGAFILSSHTICPNPSICELCPV